MTGNTATAINVSRVRRGAASQRAPARAGLEPRQAEIASPVMLGYYVRAAEKKMNHFQLESKKTSLFVSPPYLRKGLQH